MTSLKCNVLGKTGLKKAQRSAKHSKKQLMRAVLAEYEALERRSRGPRLPINIMTRFVSERTQKSRGI
jgi:hypothetical protein